MNSWIKSYIELPWEKKTVWTALSISALPILLTLALMFKDNAPAQEAQPQAADTFIPRGFVLVPIEVQNYESLDSILGRMGVVDLYQSGAAEGGPQRLVARNVRILRAPHNPSHFAILVAESESGSVLQFGAAFTVIVKRPEKAGTEFVKPDPQVRRHIIYEGR